MNYVVRSEARVDEVMEEAKKAGATILKPAAKLQWGGYGGSFADPDGYILNIAYSAGGADQPHAHEPRVGDAHPRGPRNNPSRARPGAIACLRTALRNTYPRVREWLQGSPLRPPVNHPVVR